MTERKNFVARIAVIFPIIAGIGWGVCGAFARIFTEAGLNNVTIVFARASVSLILIGIILLVWDKEKFKVKIKDLPYLIAIAVFGYVLLMLSYNAAAVSLSLSLTAILLCTAPIFVLGISTVVFGEKLTRKKVLCAIFAFAGCVMLSGVFEDSGLSWTYWGLLMGVASAACNALYILLSKVVAEKGYSALAVCFYASFFGSIILAPFTDWSSLIDYVVSDPAKSSGILVVQGIITEIFPSTSYIIAMKYLEAGRTAILESGAEPTSALIVGMIIYAEFPSLIGFAGMVITVIALMVLANDE